MRQIATTPEEKVQNAFRDREPGGISSTPKKRETAKRRFFVKSVSEMTLREQVAVIVAGISILLSLIAMIIEGSVFVVISGLLSMIMGPYAYYQQTKVTDITILKETTNTLEREVNRLKGENRKLSYSVDELTGRVEDLLDAEDALEAISNSQGQSVDALEQQAEANAHKIGQMEQSTQALVIEALIPLIYKEKENGADEKHLIITEEDAAATIRHLEYVVGLSIHRDLLRTAIVGNSVESIVDTVQNLLDEDISGNNSIFHLDKN